MDETLRELRRVLERGPSGRLGFPAEVRAQAAAWARRRRESGGTMRVLAAQLGVSHETLRRWILQGDSSTFRRVRVVETGAAMRPAVAPSGSVVLRLPSGVAVEGLAVQDIVVVLRALA